MNPFPGLRPFEANESHLFFGRERHIDEILRKLDIYRFVSVVGNSGSGKSSLIKAGLLPHIHKTRPGWKVCTFRPGIDPILSLEEALSGEALIDVASNITETLNKSKLGLVQALRHHVTSESPLLILVDQFEELFRFNSLAENEEEFERASQFVNLLLASTEQTDVPIHVIITLRSDFLGDCEQFMGLPEAINDGQFLVPRMNRNELQSSLINPVQYANGKISPRLVQHLLNQVGNSPDQLPVLQHVLMRSYDVWLDSEQIEQPMDLEHYESTGGMKNALSRHAEEAYEELSSKQKEIAEIIFRTITVKGADNRGIRRPSTVKVIAAIADCKPEKVIEVANVFRRSDRGFITPSEKILLSKDSVLDISHESLMRKWDLLAEWVDKEGNSAELYRRICESATLYEEGKASLWRDPDLQIARDWLKEDTPNEAWALQYNTKFKTAIRFIEASIQQKNFLLADKLRKRRIRNVSVILVLIILSTLSLWAFNERNNATAHANDAIEKQKEADEQKKLAEINLAKALEQEEKANLQQREAEKQKQIAEINASNAKEASIQAQTEAQKSKLAEAAAERERHIAVNQTKISDSLRLLAEDANKQSYELRMLSIAQNMAIRSKLIQDASGHDLKTLLALHAYKFNKENGGKPMDKEIYEAVFSAYRTVQNSNDYLIRMHKDYVQSVAFNSAGDLTSVGSDGRIIINTKGSAKLNIRTDEEHSFDNLAYSPTEEMLAVVNELHEIMIFASNDLTDPLHVINSGHRNKITKLLWTGDQILSFGLDSSVHIHNATSGALVSSFGLKFKPFSALIFAGPSSVLIGGDDGNIYTLDYSSQDISLFKATGQGKINCMDYEPDLNLVAYGTSNGQCGLIDLAKSKSVTPLVGHQAAIQSVQFDPGHKFLATACYDSKVRLFVLDQLQQQAINFEEHSSWVLDLCFSKQAPELASSSRDKTVRIYPLDLEAMVNDLMGKLSRELSIEEWNTYVGSDIERESL